MVYVETRPVPPAPDGTSCKICGRQVKYRGAAVCADHMGALTAPVDPLSRIARFGDPSRAGERRAKRPMNDPYGERHCCWCQDCTCDRDDDPWWCSQRCFDEAHAP